MVLVAAADRAKIRSVGVGLLGGIGAGWRACVAVVKCNLPGTLLQLISIVGNGIVTPVFGLAARHGIR